MGLNHLVCWKVEEILITKQKLNHPLLNSDIRQIFLDLEWVSERMQHTLPPASLSRLQKLSMSTQQLGGEGREI